MRVTLRESVLDRSLEVMNFLNEVVLRYPQAISFAPGRPVEHLFDVEGSLGRVTSWVEGRAAETGRPRDEAMNALGQYGRTNGQIHGAVARHLLVDEGIDVPAESIIVTAGCQEAFLILLMGLFDPARDALLVSDPAYIGITGLATIFGLSVWPVATGPDGLEPGAVAEALAAARGAGKRPKAIYDVPDFNNPLGTSMPLENRRELLAVARRHEVLIFEDNPYGRFAYDGEPMPTLKALDGESGADPVVVYLGSFAKTLYPGLRLGFLVADQRVAAAGGDGPYLAEELSRVKSLTTVNTSPIVQAVAGGVLCEHGGSLGSVIEPKRAFYKANRDAMLSALESSFRGAGLGPDEVSWNRPSGGFFLTVSLPFAFDEDCVERCAGEFGVICCPMSFFTLGGGRESEVRLSFSYVTPEEIAEGVRRFSRFVAGRLAARAAGG